MSYTDEAVKAKLSSLNESQDSIVTVAQWIMFHRRHAEKTANIWLQRIKDAEPEKRLNLIYLANEVTQQSRAKRRDEFLYAFSPVIIEATMQAYKGAPPHVQSKLQRVVQVWRERQLFDPQIQQSMDSQIAEIDKSKPHSHRRPLGGSLTASSNSSHIPAELQPLVQLQHNLSRAHLSIKPAMQEADKHYTNLTTDPPTKLPVYAGRLGTLNKTLAIAEAAVSETLKTRKSLIAGLEKLLESNREELKTEEDQLSHVSVRRAEIESKKSGVEAALERELLTGGDGTSNDIDGSDEYTKGNDGSALDSSTLTTESRQGQENEKTNDITRPDVERFTPPPIGSAANDAGIPERSTTPDGLPPTYQSGNTSEWYQGGGTTTPPEVPFEERNWAEPPRTERFTPPRTDNTESISIPISSAQDPRQHPTLLEVSNPTLSGPDPRKRAPEDSMNGTQSPNGHPNTSSIASVGGKRRKTSQDDFGIGDGDALEGLDAEVVGMLG